MKYSRLAGFCLCFIAGNALSAQLQFEKTVIEGEIPPNSGPFNFEFRFKNAGKNVIAATKLENSCACTVSELEKNVFSPGESGVIKGTLDAGSRSGIQEKEIVLYTDNPDQDRIRLLLRVKTTSPFEIKPRLLYWEKDGKAEAKSIVLTILDPTWEIYSVVSDRSKFRLEKIADRGKCHVSVTPVSTKEIIRDAIKVNLKNTAGTLKEFTVHALVK